jgi:hypothetical protein
MAKKIVTLRASTDERLLINLMEFLSREVPGYMNRMSVGHLAANSVRSARYELNVVGGVPFLDDAKRLVKAFCAGWRAHKAEPKQVSENGKSKT